MALADVLSAVSSCVTSALGWMQSFLGVFSTANGLILIPAILSISLFGIHVLKSLMGR